MVWAPIVAQCNGRDWPISRCCDTRGRVQFLWDLHGLPGGSPYHMATPKVNATLRLGGHLANWPYLPNVAELVAAVLVGFSQRKGKRFPDRQFQRFNPNETDWPPSRTRPLLLPGSASSRRCGNWQPLRCPEQPPSGTVCADSWHHRMPAQNPRPLIFSLLFSTF